MAQSFAQHASNTRQSLQQIKQRMDVLQGGDWVGQGATGFFREMTSDVLPAFNRLLTSLEQAGQDTKKMSDIMKQAEEEAARFFRLDRGAGAAMPVGAFASEVAAGEAEGSAAGDGGGGDGAAGGSTAGSDASSVLNLHQKVPDKGEVEAVGAITGKVVRGTPEFDALVKNDNPDIDFKDEEGTGADQMMTPRMKEKLDALAAQVKNEWPDAKLRVTEAWDESGEHNPNSTHYEGRAVDITVSDKDSAKLGRLSQLAVDSGFDWVFYENSVHVHASVTKGE